MIKILFFIEKLAYNGSIGGAEKVLVNLVNHLDAEKYDITVQTVFPDPLSGLLKNTVRYRYCYPAKNRLTKLLYRAEAEAGLTYRLHVKDDYDIEVAYLEYDSTKVMAASTNKKAKKIAWVHCDFNVAVKDKAAFVKKAAPQYSKFDKVICVSGQCRQSFVSLFGREQDTVVVYNVVDDEDIRQKAQEPLPDGCEKQGLTLCAVGRFSPVKNHERMLRAVRDMVDSGWNLKLWLVGDGETRKQVEEIIISLQLQNYVKCWGFQSNPYPFMKAADLLLCSSDYEGFSTFVTEGIVLGKQILTTDCSGMHELLDGYAGGTVVANSDEAFKKGLENWLREYELNGKAEENIHDGRFCMNELVASNERFFEGILQD